MQSTITLFRNAVSAGIARRHALGTLIGKFGGHVLVILNLVLAGGNARRRSDAAIAALLAESGHGPANASDVAAMRTAIAETNSMLNAIDQLEALTTRRDGRVLWAVLQTANNHDSVGELTDAGIRDILTNMRPPPNGAIQTFVMRN